QRYFQQAAELTDDPLVKAAFDERAGRMATRRGRAEEAIALLTEAQRVLEEAGRIREAAMVSAPIADAEGRMGRSLEALSRLEAALETLSGDEPDAGVAEVAAQLGRFLTLDGRSEDARGPLELALGVAEALQLTEIFAQALISKSMSLTST